MSEKRFSETERNCYYTSLVFDNQTQEKLGTTKVVDKLNEQQSDLVYLARFIGEFKVEEFRLKLRNLRMLEDKVLEQQTTIDKQERRIMVLENLLTNMGVKWVGDDD